MTTRWSPIAGNWAELTGIHEEICMRPAVTALATVIILAPLLTGCGGGSEDSAVEPSPDPVAASRSAAAEAEAAEQAAEIEAEREAAQEEYDECHRNVNPLLKALQEIDSRLTIGLNVGEYGDLLGDAVVAYDRGIDNVDVGPGGLKAKSCFTVALGLEEAVNLHIKVHDAWNDCIDDYACDFNAGEINRVTQKRWREAGRYTDRAADNLDDLAPVS